ncbi:hypothetical protein [Longimicrobium sp.]|uniref:hypothetical protein n=1 Tax=Longimicrobium sp. TaxID=2029185 RepID=UPI002F95021E
MSYDSAGIQVQNTGTGIEPSAWALEAEPVISIGEVDGAPEYMLHDVRGALRLPDGGVVVANSGSNELRWYDAAGRHVRSAGRDGGGPGEFLSLAGLAAGPGGRVHAWDATSLRLSTFGADAGLQGYWTVPADSFGPNVELAGVLADNSVVLLDGSSTVFTLSPAPRRDSMRIWHASPGGAVRRMMTIPGPERITWGSAQGAVRSPAPFARSTLTAVGDDRVWIGDNERYEVGGYGDDGRLRRLVRRAAAPRKVSDREKDEYRRAWRERVGSGGPVPGAALETFLAEMPFPETHPAFSALHVDSEGRLWVRERDDAAGSHWAVHDEDGRLAGSLTLPPRAEPLDISANHVVARWTDEDGVEFVRVYRFRP